MARTRWPRASRLLACAAAMSVVLSVAPVDATSAILTAQGGNGTNVFSMTALYAPASLTASPVGHDASLSWPAGQNGNGYSVLGVNNGTSSNCSTPTYSSIASTTSLSYSDTGRYTPQGTWFCYQIQTTYASWTSVASNPTAGIQLGFVAVSIVPSNGGTSGKLDAGDKIVVTFNQAVGTATGPAGTDTVCAVSGATIMIATTTLAGSCGTGEALDLGKLTGGSSNRNARYSATYAWSNGNKTLTVTIGVRTSGSADPTVSGTWTFNPTTTATKMLSSTGSFHICDTNTGGGNCLPTTGSTF